VTLDSHWKVMSPAVVVLALLVSPPAHAYLGPGGAVTGIGTLLALLAALVAAVFGFLWYPIRRLLRFRKDASKARADKQLPPDEGPDA